VSSVRREHHLGMGKFKTWSSLLGDVMDTAYRFWRRDWGKPGSRKSGGVLVWQLNDCWPTMSWALVDYHLVKKPSFYAIGSSATGKSQLAFRAPKSTGNHSLA
jgi:beta-mannosidase